uniref:Uncharacterized protein n=1 Tax=Magnetococcus massalia (strain MO-1) TaxID=451514 RepID=A0A1S7LF74_MAGMO|nr:Protein of unknown function [Candidatus Magnetococcus massalia]
MSEVAWWEWFILIPIGAWVVFFIGRGIKRSFSPSAGGCGKSDCSCDSSNPTPPSQCPTTGAEQKGAPLPFPGKKNSA